MSVSRKLHWLRIALVLYACVVSCHVDATCSSDRLRNCVLLPLAVWLIIMSTVLHALLRRRRRAVG